jgi:hypothetical protein
MVVERRYRGRHMYCFVNSYTAQIIEYQTHSHRKAVDLVDQIVLLGNNGYYSSLHKNQGVPSIYIILCTIRYYMASVHLIVLVID